VRVLLWAGAPVPLFRPSRRMARKTRDQLVAAGRVRCELDPRERPLHCHHEKTIVFDGREAFVGGIDLTSLSGDRRDSSRHPARAAVAGTTSRPSWQARWSPTWPSTSPCAGGRSPASALPPPHPRPPPDPPPF